MFVYVFVRSTRLQRGGKQRRERERGGGGVGETEGERGGNRKIEGLRERER